MSRERAERILQLAHETGALLHGDFVLASGARSKHYFDGRLVALHPEGAYQIGMEILEKLSGLEIGAVGGLEMGAVPIATAVSLCSYLEGKPLPAFVVRRQAKEHGTRKKVEGHLRDGARVAIVDDVITQGGSVLQAIEAVEATNCKVVKVVVIVDRHEGGSDTLKSKGYEVSAILDLWPSGETTIGEAARATT